MVTYTSQIFRIERIAQILGMPDDRVGTVYAIAMASVPVNVITEGPALAQYFVERSIWHGPCKFLGINCLLVLS